MAKRKISAKRKFSALTVIGVIICVFCCILFVSCENSSVNSYDKESDFVKVLDVGQGDCTLFYSNGYTALIDMGTLDYAEEICMALKEYSITEIDVAIITHLHSDHLGAAQRLTELFKINNVILPELSVESEGLGAAELLIANVTDDGVGVYNAQQGMNFELGEFEFTVLASYGDMEDENNRSVITAVEMDGLKFIFSGDAEAEAEKRLLDEGLDLKCDFFKAGHHGSSTSNTEELLSEMKPRYTVISCGEDNMYGHPHNEVLANFEYVGTEIYRTDCDGDVTFNVKNGKIKVETEK